MVSIWYIITITWRHQVWDPNILVSKSQDFPTRTNLPRWLKAPYFFNPVTSIQIEKITIGEMRFQVCHLLSWKGSLVGGFNQPIWKIWVKMGSSSPIFGVKIKNIWNHHLALKFRGPQNPSPSWIPQEWMIFLGAPRSFETQKALRLLTFHAWKLFTKFHASPWELKVLEIRNCLMVMHS